MCSLEKRYYPKYDLKSTLAFQKNPSQLTPQDEFKSHKMCWKLQLL